MVLGRVRVAGEAHRMFAPLEQPEELILVGEVLVGLVAEIGPDRNMHDDDDERLRRRVRQHAADEFELRLVEPPLVFAGAPRLCRVGTEIVDVVEHEEERLRVEERVVVRTEESLVGLAAVCAVGRLEIEVVVAADVPPRQSDRADDRVEARIEREVVEHDVAGGEPEFRVDAGERLDQVLADEIDLRLGLGLRIGHHHDLERLRLVLAFEREIERGRHRSGRREALEDEVERGGRAVRLMMAVEARQPVSGSTGGMKPAGLTTKIVASSGSGSV